MFIVLCHFERAERGEIFPRVNERFLALLEMKSERHQASRKDSKESAYTAAYRIPTRLLMNSAFIILMVWVIRIVAKDRRIRMNKYQVIFSFLLIFSFPAYSQAGSSYKAEGWPGSSKYQIVRNYGDFQKRVWTLASPRIKVAQAGSVTYDKVTYPILSLTYIPQANPALRVFLASGQHGNEPAGPEAVLAFFKALLAEPSGFKDVAIDAIPMVNPWGWSHDIRYDGAGYDTNRDFVSFVTGEAAAVRDFTNDKRYDLVIDHHEASRDGAFIYCYGDEDVDMSNRLVQQLTKDGYAVASIGWNMFASNDNGVIAIPGGAFSSIWQGRSVLPRYFTSTMNAHSFTFETSTFKVFADRIACHMEVMKFLINELRTR
jgi:hypothetical protein